MRADGAQTALNWEEIDTVQDVVRVYPDRVQALMTALNLDHPGLEAVREVVGRKDWVTACEALLAYYRQKETPPWVAQRWETPPADGQRQGVDDALEDRFTFYQETDVVPRDARGLLNWHHRGPNRDRQWALALNRHQWFGHMAAAWRLEGDLAIAEVFDRQVRDWAIQHGSRSPSHDDQWTASLQPGLRMGGPWQAGFYGFQDAEAFKPATRILMLASLAVHGEFLRHHHKRNHNWTTMELNGLGQLAIAFPEFRNSGDWLAAARDILTEELKGQVGPDGAQDELTTGYHMVALDRFHALFEGMEAAGHTVSDEYRQNVEGMWDYLARVMRPNGSGPLNSNSDLRFYSDRLVTVAGQFGRPDWHYIATRGEQGERPVDPPSRFMPYAGQMVSRSGWDERAHWSFFDIGPHGTNGHHAHPDKLHLSVHAYGRDLLVDTGRFVYSGALAVFRDAYAMHSRSHNLVLIDGATQTGGPARFGRPIPRSQWAIEQDYDYARSSTDGFAGLEGKAVHHRELYYRRGGYWVVVDRIETDRPRTIEPLWHFHPDCTVTLEGLSLLTTDAGVGNVRVVPAGGPAWEVELLKGQRQPHPMGWYCACYGEAEPTTVARYRAKVEAGVTTFAWLIVPGEGTAPDASLELVEADDATTRLRGRIEVQPAWELTLPPAARPWHLWDRSTGRGKRRI